MKPSSTSIARLPLEIRQNVLRHVINRTAVRGVCRQWRQFIEDPRNWEGCVWCISGSELVWMLREGSDEHLEKIVFPRLRAVKGLVVDFDSRAWLLLYQLGSPSRRTEAFIAACGSLQILRLRVTESYVEESGWQAPHFVESLLCACAENLEELYVQGLYFPNFSIYWEESLAAIHNLLIEGWPSVYKCKWLQVPRHWSGFASRFYVEDVDERNDGDAELGKCNDVKGDCLRAGCWPIDELVDIWRIITRVSTENSSTRKQLKLSRLRKLTAVRTDIHFRIQASAVLEELHQEEAVEIEPLDHRKWLAILEKHKKWLRRFSYFIGGGEEEEYQNMKNDKQISEDFEQLEKEADQQFSSADQDFEIDEDDGDGLLAKSDVLKLSEQTATLVAAVEKCPHVACAAGRLKGG